MDANPVILLLVMADPYDIHWWMIQNALPVYLMFTVDLGKSEVVGLKYYCLLCYDKYII